MSDSSTPPGTLTARIEERILQPLRANAFARRTWFSVTLALVVSIYAGALAWMLWRDAADPPKGAPVQEAAVEIVPEMPKPPAPTPQPQPKQEAEKPATSAPRAFNDAKDDEHEDKETRAPKAAEKPPEPAPQPVQEAAAQPAEPPAAAPAEKPEEAPPVEKKVEAPDKEAEALEKAPPEPPKKPQKLAQAKPTPPKPKPKPRPAKSVAQQLASASELPDFTFAKPMRKRAKVTGGTEDDRYLALVYGLITQNHRPVAYPYGDWAVAVSFVVDGGGNLIGAQISRSSGIPEVDSEAVAAVEEAAPFPPPPSGGNTGMVARLRSGSAQAFAGER